MGQFQQSADGARKVETDDGLLSSADGVDTVLSQTEVTIEPHRRVEPDPSSHHRTPWNHDHSPPELISLLYRITRLGLLVGSGFLTGVLFVLWLLY